MKNAPSRNSFRNFFSRLRAEIIAYSAGSRKSEHSCCTTRPASGSVQPVEDVAAQRVPGWQSRMVEILGGIVHHPELLHHPARSGVRWHGKRHELIQPQDLKCVRNDVSCPFGGQARSPVLRRQSPSDLAPGVEGACKEGTFRPMNPKKLASRRSSAAYKPNPCSRRCASILATSASLSSSERAHGMYSITRGSALRRANGVRSDSGQDQPLASQYFDGCYRRPPRREP